MFACFRKYPCQHRVNQGRVQLQRGALDALGVLQKVHLIL